MTPSQKIAVFHRLFRGRPDVFAVRWENATKSGYRPVHAPYEPKVIGHHLTGKMVVGVYPLLKNHNTWFLAIDCDGPRAAADARALAHQCRERELPVYLERSRSGLGFHLWFFFQQPLSAGKARAFARHLVQSAQVQLPSLDRFFPSQDCHSGSKGIGNLIALPLQREARFQNNTVFVDPETLEPYEDQWELLQRIRYLTEEEMDLTLSEEADALYAPLPLIKPDPQVRDSEIQHGPLQVTLKEHIEISLPCPAVVLDFLKDVSRFQNPIWFNKFRQGHYLGDTPRFLRCGGKAGQRWVMARGLWPELKALLEKESLGYNVSDLRSSPPEIVTEPLFQLRPDQLEAVLKLLPCEEAVLEAPTGTGKTVIALELIARRGLPALILVPSRALLEQWLERLKSKLGISQREVGRVRQSQLKLGERVTVATFQSLARRDLEEVARHCGHVIVDECHHVPAKTFATVLRQLRPRFLLGLTATPRRKDQLERLIFAYLGQKVKSATPKELERKSVIVLPKVVVHPTRFEHPGAERIQTVLSDASKCEERNRQIADDVADAVERGHLVLLLSDRKEHCDQLSDALSDRLGVATLYGQVGKKAKKKIFTEFESGEVQVLIATARLLGEGWDCPPLSALFLAFPMGGSPRLEQLAGRLTRPDPEKPDPELHDYRDQKVIVLEAMFQRRLKVFRRLLGDERLPTEFRTTRSDKRASISYGSQRGRQKRKSQVVRDREAGQLSLFED